MSIYERISVYPTLLWKKKPSFLWGREDFLWISCFLESVTLINMMRGGIKFYERRANTAIPPHYASK
jgi:hypothetical protein